MERVWQIRFTLTAPLTTTDSLTIPALLQYLTLEGSEAVGNNNAAGLFSKFGFAGDLAGTATSAKYVETTNAGTDAATYYPALLASTTGQTHSERVDVHGGIVYEVTGDGTGDLTINGNLTVVGSATKVGDPVDRGSNC